MKVAFYYHSQYEDSDVLMSKAVKSVRLAMPHAKIWHLRGPNVVKHPGVDDEHLYKDFHRSYHQHLFLEKEGEALFLDIDCWVQKDVSEVFKKSFDVALCVRPNRDFDKPETWGATPYNGGVMFCRSSGFWKEFSEFNRRRWTDFTLCEFIGKKKYNVLSLPSSIHYWPDSQEEDVSNYSIVHYKGRRKAWMVERP